MGFYSKRINDIQLLTDADSADEVLLGVLKCRLLLERIVFDRLRANKKYLGNAAFEKWKPKDALRYLTEQATNKTIEEFTVSIAKGAPEGDGPHTVEQFERLDWTSLGKQTSISPYSISKLWHACSSLLHESSGESDFSSSIVVAKSKIAGVLELARAIDNGNMLGGMFQGTVEFRCNCDCVIVRPIEALSEDILIDCPNPNCKESYLPQQDKDNWRFQRRFSYFSCPECVEDVEVPTGYVDQMRGNQTLIIKHKCGMELRCVLKPSFLRPNI